MENTQLKQIREPEGHEETIDNRIELLKFTTEVKSRVGEEKDINSDFIMSVLEEQDKELTIEMTQNAKLVKKLINIYKLETTHSWDKYKNKWKEEKIELSETQKDIITKIADRTFDTLMSRIQMIQIVNRNKPKNPILRILGGQPDPTDDEEHLDKIEELKLKLKEATRLKKPEKQEE